MKTCMELILTAVIFFGLGMLLFWGLDEQVQDHDNLIQSIEEGHANDHIFDL